MNQAEVPWRKRVLLAACLTLVAAIYSWFQHRYFLASGTAPDSIVVWRAARMLWDGGDPWNAAQWAGAGARYLAEDSAWRIPMAEPMYYPMPAVLVWLPLARLPFLAASVVFNAASTFAFVYAVTRHARYRAWLCGTMSFFIAMRFGQWSPLIVAAVLLPALNPLLVTKPNLGLPLWVAWPSWRSGVACALALVLPTLWRPTWVLGWWQGVTGALGQTTPHPAPIQMFGGAGVLMLGVLFRWRRPEARLIAIAACLPQLPYWADQLPLLLVAKSEREVLGCTLLSLLGMVVWLLWFAGHGDPVDTMRPISIVCTYLPAIAMVLRSGGEPRGTGASNSSASTSPDPVAL